MIEKEIWQIFKDRGLKVYAIGVQENVDQTSSWGLEHRLTYPVILDPEGEIYKKFGNGSVPHHVFIDKKFIIRLSEEKFDEENLIRIMNHHLKSEN